MNPAETSQLKEETLRWIFSMLCAALVYVLVAFIVTSVYHPDIEHLKNVANDLLIEPAMVRPEPMEALLFRLAVIIIIPAIAAFYALFSKAAWIKSFSKKPVYLILSSLVLAAITAITYFDFAALNPFWSMGGDHPQNIRDTTAKTNFDFYFEGIFLGQYFWLYALVLVPLMACLFFIAIKKYNWQNKMPFRVIASVTGYSIIAGTLISIIFMNTIYFPYSAENKLDFAAIYYSMTQVYAGSPMLVNHFMDTYGLYPQFLNPLFQLIGLSVFKFTLVMSLLIGLCFSLNLYVLRKLVGNNIILFLGFTTILFFSYLNFKFLTLFDCVFNYFPIRYLAPSVLTFLTYLYVTKRSQKIFWATSIVSAFFILWNPEIGIVCYLSWLAVNIYINFYAPGGTIAWKAILRLIGLSAGILAAAMCTYALFIYVFYGSWPHLGLLFGTVLVFSKIGFFLLPMSLVHPWNLMAIVLMVGFTYAIVKWHKKEITQRSSMVLLISLIALGYFVYFQGRSHNSNFALSSGYCLMLLTILGDDLWQLIKKTNVFFINALFVVFLFFVSFSFAEIVFSKDKMVDLINQEGDKSRQLEAPDFIENNNNFIVKNTGEHEKILLLAPKKNQALYFNGNKRISAFNPGFVEMFYKTDLDRFAEIIADSSFSIFSEVSHMYSFMAGPVSAVAATYEFKTAIPTMFEMCKRTTLIPAQTFFNTGGRFIIHRKYSDDSTGIHLRMNDALGIGNFTLPPVFSVQVLFKTWTQVYEKAMLVGNVEIRDSLTNGFAIGNVVGAEKYYFMINGNGFVLNIPNNEWAYCVMNVFPDHMEVYENGNRVCYHPLPQPMRPSMTKIGVSNIDYPYVGAIAEVAVANTALDSNEIRATFGKIKAVFYK